MTKSAVLIFCDCWQDVLVPLVLGKENDLRQMALRIICSERPPGESVKFTPGKL